MPGPARLCLCNGVSLLAKPSCQKSLYGKGARSKLHRLAKCTYSFNQNLMRSVIEAIVVCPAGVGLM